jgi:glycosyltransferase involved in cell wall biosynthesis
MARAARELGLHVAVVARLREHRGAIEAAGAQAIPLEAERGSLNPFAAVAAAGRIAAILKRERADLVHCIALRSILVGGAAALMAGVPRRIYALTGSGLSGTRQDAFGIGARAALRALIRGPLATPETRYLFENGDDPRLLGLDPADARVAIAGGAGVDPDIFRPQPPPPWPPLKVAVVSRMLWSKGVDLAVEAVRLARARGAAVRLSLVGAPDPSNRRSIPEATLRAWGSEPGISWTGPTGDVPAVWRDHHLACLPSRGGEGLPRTLLEAAACGRPLLTTDVPGCRALVRDGVEGLVVSPNDAPALADALARLAGDSALVVRLGEAARARVLDGFTERDVMATVKGLYAAMLLSP